MTDFLLYRSCDLTDLGVRQILGRQTDVIDRGIALISSPSGQPADTGAGSDNPTLDIVAAEWGAPSGSGGGLVPGTYDYDIVPVDTCTGRTGTPIALPQLTVAGTAATGTIVASSEDQITDGDSFVLNDGVNPAVTFKFDKGAIQAAIGSILPVAENLITDGDSFALNDGVNPAVTFEFDKNASVVETSTLRAVTLAGSETISAVSGLIFAAISAAPALDITAKVVNAGIEVSLTNDAVGVVGNQAVTQTGTAPLVVTGMAGGSGAANTSTLRHIFLGVGASSGVVANDIRAVISAAPALDISGSGNGVTTNLVNDLAGVVGNQAITQIGTAPLVVTGMTGGSTLGQISTLRLEFGSLPGDCDAAQIRRDGIIVGDVFPLDNIPPTVTVVTQPSLVGDYTTTPDSSPGQILDGGRAGFFRQNGAELIGGDVIRYNDFTVRVLSVIGSSAPQTVLFSPPIPQELIEPEGFYDASNRTGYYEAFSTTFNLFAAAIPGFGAIAGSYAPVWPLGSGITWPGPFMSFKTIPNHTRTPIPGRPFLNDIQAGDIIAYGSKTALVVYVENSPIALPDGVNPAAGTVLVLPFGVLPIPPLPAGRFWIIYRSLRLPEFGFYYSTYKQPGSGAGPPDAGGVDQGLGDPTGLFADFDDVGPTLIRGGVTADGGSGSGFAYGTIVTDNSGAEAVQVLDGEQMVIDDGTTAVTYEFDSNNSVVETPTLRRVDISAATSSTDLQNLIINAVNLTPSFNVSATSGAINVVQLKNSVAGAGAVGITTTIVSILFTVSGMVVSNPSYTDFLAADSYNPGQPQNDRHRLNSFRVLGNGQGGNGPPTALFNGQMLLIDGTLVTVNEVSDLIPPGGFPDNPLPGFPGTYEVEFSPDIGPNPLKVFPLVEASRPLSPIGPWVTVPGGDSPYLVSPTIAPTGQYTRLTRQNLIEQRDQLWQFEEDGADLDAAGVVDGTSAAKELDEVFVQNDYPGGLAGLLDKVRGPRTTKASDVFVVTNGTLTAVTDRMLPCNPSVTQGNGVTIDLAVIRGLVTNTCDSAEKLFEVNTALTDNGFAVLRQEIREVQVSAAACPPGQPDAREVKLFCLGVATAADPVRVGEVSQVYFREGTRVTPSIRAQLRGHGLSEREADAALDLKVIDGVAVAEEILDRTFADIADIEQLGTAQDVQDILDDVRIETINTGKVTRAMIGEIIRNRGDSGIIRRHPGTDPVVARDPASRPLDDLMLPMHRLAALSFTLQASFDLCDYDAALASVSDEATRAQIGAYFATVEGLLSSITRAGEAMTTFLDGNDGFKQAMDAIGGIVSGSDGDATMACLVGPQSFGAGAGISGASLGVVNTRLANLSSSTQRRFNLSQLFGKAMLSALCSTTGALDSVISYFGGEADQSSIQRAMGCLPSIEDITSAGIGFPSLEVQVAFECSLDQLSTMMDIVTALISEATEFIDFSNALETGFVSRTVEARNRMCSADPGIQGLLGGLRAFIGL